MKRAHWTPDAKADLAKIDDFYTEIALDYADKVGDAAIAAAQFLLQFPYAGTSIDIDDVRKWRVRATPYILIYRTQRDAVQILRIRHMAEDWQNEP
jgi:plasmid stabilization system protein ParE